MLGIHFTNTRLDRACASWYSRSMKLFKNKKLVLIVIIVLLSLVAALFVLEKKGITNLIGNNNTNLDDEAKTTSNAATAQEDYKDGNPREAGNTIDENRGSATVIDNGGRSSSVDTSNPVVSKTGEITVYSPAANAILTNPTNISGKSTLSKISYRLIDNVSGVISTGELSVVNGSFSARLSFETSAQTGRLDIYGTKPDGVEFSSIEIPVRFK